MDPLNMKNIVGGLSSELAKDFGLDVSARAADLETQLANLNANVAVTLAVVPATERKLITGHESMGYFADRYNFQIIGVIIPSLSSQAEVSAADLANLKIVIQQNQVKAIFTELGTSAAVADAIGRETGVQVVELSTHVLPADGSYFTFMQNIANTIANALK